MDITGYLFMCPGSSFVIECALFELWNHSLCISSCRLSTMGLDPHLTAIQLCPRKSLWTHGILRLDIFCLVIGLFLGIVFTYASLVPPIPQACRPFIPSMTTYQPYRCSEVGYGAIGMSKTSSYMPCTDPHRPP